VKVARNESIQHDDKKEKIRVKVKEILVETIMEDDIKVKESSEYEILY
jgi:hypothetical protein